MQRVRVGLTGLAAILLIVAAAAAVFESASDRLPTAAGAAGNSATVAQQNASNLIDSAPETPNEPLAEIGVAPGAGPTETEKAAANEQAAAPPVAGATP